MQRVCQYGWRGGAEPGLGRVVRSHGDYYHVVCDESPAEILARKKKGAFAADGSVKPMTGDFVRFVHNPAGESMITEVCPRWSSFSRRDPTARRRAQTLAVNFDCLFVMMGLDGDFSLARLERYLALAGEAGDARVFAVLTKADVAKGLPAGGAAELVPPSLGAETLVVSAKTGFGMEAVREIATPRTTIALVGSSGVGKSTLVNALAGKELMATQEVQSWSGRGRHTTTSRELVMLPCGAMVVDTPGIREIGMVGEVDATLAKGESTHRWRRASSLPLR